MACIQTCLRALGLLEHSCSCCWIEAQGRASTLVCHDTESMLRKRSHLAHDFGKAHGFINARDGPRQVCQEGALVVASCQPGILRIRIHLLSTAQPRQCSGSADREVVVLYELMGLWYILLRLHVTKSALLMGFRPVSSLLPEAQVLSVH